MRRKTSIQRPAGRAVLLASVRSIAMPMLLGGLFGCESGPSTATRYDVFPDTVRDNITGLTWQRGTAPEPTSLDLARQYCSDATWGGRDDWRLPSMQEFQTIVDETRANPAIDPTLFPDTPPEGFWSGTSWAGTPLLAWHVDFDKGSAAYDTATMPYRVRCVRWGK